MRGLLLEEIEPIPRTRMTGSAPGAPFVLYICTPATLPASAVEALETTRLLSVSLPTTPAAPVNASFFCLP